jgi:RHS repeat-associated protein
VQTSQSRIQTVYAAGSFTPLVRVETEAAEQAKAQHRSLAERLSQEGSEDGREVQFPAALTAMLDRLEGELRRNAVSEESQQWLAGFGLTVAQMAGQLEPYDEPERKIHLYHCDHRGLPLALVSPDNTLAWRAEYDEWGNQLSEESPEHLEQQIRLPGQQYDEESGLHYNRHRYYDPGLGRYITQDPIGLRGGLNSYKYPLDPVSRVDPLGLIDFPGYNTSWGNSVGGISNEVSKGDMSYGDGARAIQEQSGPHYSPPIFSVSADGGVSAYGIFGGSVSAGITTGNGDKGLDICVYITNCQGAGTGAAGGASISGSVSNAPPGSGVSYYGGATTDVGFLVNGAATVLTELNKNGDPVHISTGLSGGVGGGSFGGLITCQQYTKCLVN